MLQTRLQVPLCLLSGEDGVGWGYANKQCASLGLDLPAALPVRVCVCFDSVKRFARFCSHSTWEWKQNFKVLQIRVVLFYLSVAKTIETVNKTQTRNRWRTLGRWTDSWPCLVPCYAFAILHWNQILEYLEAIIYWLLWRIFIVQYQTTDSTTD